jgi:hypothetical protein
MNTYTIRIVATEAIFSIFMLYIPFTMSTDFITTQNKLSLAVSAREIEREAQRGSPAGGDHGRALAAADDGRRPVLPPCHVPSYSGLPVA